MKLSVNKGAVIGVAVLALLSLSASYGYKEIRREAFRAGQAIGERLGYEEGHAAGYEEASAENYEEAREEGRMEVRRGNDQYQSGFSDGFRDGMKFFAHCIFNQPAGILALTARDTCVNETAGKLGMQPQAFAEYLGIR